MFELPEFEIKLKFVFFLSFVNCNSVFFFQTFVFSLIAFASDEYSDLSSDAMGWKNEMNEAISQRQSQPLYM